MRSSKNHFGVLANLESDEHFPSLTGTKNAGDVPILDSERTPYHVFRDAADLRLQLLLMKRDQSLDRQSKKYVISSVKELEVEEKLTKVVPFDSARIASLEARIRSMKGLSPLRIQNLAKELQSPAGALFQRGASSVDKNEAKKEGIPKPLEQGLLTSTMVRSSPDEDKGAGLEILKDANPAADQSVEDGSVVSSASEEEETSDEEVDSPAGEEKQEEVVPSEAQGSALQSGFLGQGISSSGSDSVDPVGEGISPIDNQDNNGLFDTNEGDALGIDSGRLDAHQALGSLTVDKEADPVSKDFQIGGFAVLDSADGAACLNPNAQDGPSKIISDHVDKNLPSLSEAKFQATACQKPIGTGGHG
ncbi:hypothetical protein U1Q18_037849 [Sarracenia purpurea var. burkii]